MQSQGHDVKCTVVCGWGNPRALPLYEASVWLLPWQGMSALAGYECRVCDSLKCNSKTLQHLSCIGTSEVYTNHSLSDTHQLNKKHQHEAKINCQAALHQP